MYGGGPGGRVGGRDAREWVQPIDRAYIMKQARLYMDKIENISRDNHRVNRDGAVADINMKK